MANRLCVMFAGMRHVPVINDAIMRFRTAPPLRIGDDAEIIVGGVLTGELRRVRLLRSEGMVLDALYLVDLERKEAFPYTESGPA